MKNLITLYREPTVVSDPPAAVIPPVVTPPLETPPVAAAPQVIDTTPKSAATTVDINAKPVVPPSFVIPDLYKDKPYLKGIDSMEKLYAMLDGAQTLIGAKGPAIPKADAPQAEKDAYFEAKGRPKTPEEYKLTGTEKADPAFLPRLLKAFHKNGFNNEEATALYADVNGELQEWMKEKGLVEAQQDIDFTKLATDTFAAERDNVMVRGKELIGELSSPSMKPAIAKLDNNALIVIADLMRNVDKKYIKQDGGMNRQPTITAGTPDELRAKARGLMVEQGKHTPMSAEFNNLQTQIDGIYDQIKRSGVKIS